MARPIVPSIPAALETRRNEFGWTQRKMAQQLGIRPSHYSEVASGNRPLSYAAACKAYRLGVPATVFLTLKNKSQLEL